MLGDDTALEWLDRYAEGDAAGLLAVEYELLVALARRFSEPVARATLAPGVPTALELITHLAREAFPDGPPPSLSDALHALDLLFAAWQAEEAPFQRVQARRLALCHGALALLHRCLAPPS